MTYGDKVKVRIIFAGGRVQLAAWFGGYTFAHEEPETGCVLVKHADGIFAGVLSRYSCDAVRLDTNPDKRVESV